MSFDNNNNDQYSNQNTGLGSNTGTFGTSDTAQGNYGSDGMNQQSGGLQGSGLSGGQGRSDFNELSGGATGYSGSGSGGLDDMGGAAQRQHFGSSNERDTSSGNNMGSGVAGGEYGSGITGGGLSSGAGAGGDFDNTSSGYNNSSGNQYADETNYGGNTQQKKPGMGAKVMGNMEKMAGKVTKNPGLQEQGQERATGNQF